MTNTKNNEKCSYCEYDGIVYNSNYLELGEEPLQPCPRCVVPSCRCGKKEPYYYIEDGEIKDCSCRDVMIRIQRIKKIYGRSGIEKKFRWKFLGDFITKSKQANEAKMAAFNIVKDFPKVKKGLFLWGNPGTGKTMLSTIILTELICRNNIEGRFVKISRTFFQLLKETFNTASDTYGQSGKIERALYEVDILVLDDFGVQRDSPWEQETLYNLVDARYENQKFTIFTSNHNPLKTFNELSEGRVLSRIREMCSIMELSGDDFRTTL
jgi:DNA replication protein DnaC